MRQKITGAIHHKSSASQYAENSSAIYMNSGYAFENAQHAKELFAGEAEGYLYSRYSNPNTSELINKMVMLEKAQDGLSFASGMAAIFCSFGALLSAGDHILASRSLFGSTHQILNGILSRWGITHSFVDADKPETWEAAIQSNTKMIFMETPSNPGLDIIDLEWLGNLKKKHDLILNVDNTFATPLIQNPIEFGADLVCHSTTKLIDGQGRTLGGILVGNKDLMEEVRFFARQTGPSLSPFNAWILSKSLETLALRVERHSDNAMQLARELEAIPFVKKVRYPFLPSHPSYKTARKQMRLGGSMVTFELEGDFEQVRVFIDALKLAVITANLGDTQTLVTHPASTTHSRLSEEERQQMRIGQGLIRVSVGLEHIEDIISDFRQALEKLNFK